jgi:hypothetical protein
MDVTGFGSQEQKSSQGAITYRSWRWVKTYDVLGSAVPLKNGYITIVRDDLR